MQPNQRVQHATFSEHGFSGFKVIAKVIDDSFQFTVVEKRKFKVIGQRCEFDVIG